MLAGILGANFKQNTISYNYLTIGLRQMLQYKTGSDKVKGSCWHPFPIMLQLRQKD